MWRPLWTLIKCEAWAYRVWWTQVALAFGLCTGSGVAWLIMEHLIYAKGDFYQATVFLYWCGGCVLLLSGIIAWGHAAHAFFDERQDGSAAFWTAFPVSRKMRLTAKVLAMACWPLVAWVFISLLAFSMALFIVAFDTSFALQELQEAWWRLTQVAFESALMSVPSLILWAWCSLHAPKSPWAWGLAGGCIMALVGVGAGWGPSAGGYVACGPLWTIFVLLFDIQPAQPWHSPLWAGVLLLAGWCFYLNTRPYSATAWAGEM